MYLRVAYNRKNPPPIGRLIAVAFPVVLGVLASCLCMGAAVANEQLQALDGMLEPDMVVDVASPVPGVVESVNVDRSDIVTKDQVLAELEDSVQQAQLRVAQTRAQLSGEIRAREASKIFADRRQARTNQLWDKRVIPLDDRDEAEARARVAAEDVNAAREKRTIANGELSLAEAEVDQRVIRSPIDGVVVDRFIQPGNRVDDQALIRIASIDPLRVEVVVPYDYFDSIKTGMRAEVQPELPVDGEFVATVTRVDRVIDAASGTFMVRLSLPNPNGRLPSGLKCKVVFPQGLTKLYQRPDAIDNIAVTPLPVVPTPPTDAGSVNSVSVPAPSADRSAPAEAPTPAMPAAPNINIDSPAGVAPPSFPRANASAGISKDGSPNHRLWLKRPPRYAHSDTSAAVGRKGAKQNEYDKPHAGCEPPQTCLGKSLNWLRLQQGLASLSLM